MCILYYTKSEEIFVERLFFVWIRYVLDFFWLWQVVVVWIRYVLDFYSGSGRLGIHLFVANLATAKFVSRFGGFQHSRSACQLLTVETNETSLGLSSLE